MDDRLRHPGRRNCRVSLCKAVKCCDAAIGRVLGCMWARGGESAAAALGCAKEQQPKAPPHSVRHQSFSHWAENGLLFTAGWCWWRRPVAASMVTSWRVTSRYVCVVCQSRVPLFQRFHASISAFDPAEHSQHNTYCSMFYICASPNLRRLDRKSFQLII